MCVWIEMKVGLFTYHFSDNYGALFQAYALRKWFMEQGIAADFINYHPTYVEEGGPLDRPWKVSRWRKNVTILYMRLSHTRRQWFGDRAQRAAFDVFRRDHLGITGPRSYSASDLTDKLTPYDMLVCGSDQIWNPSIQRGLDPVYFLDISGAEHARRVAYAPSFGRISIEPEHHAELARMLSGLDAIGVRETSGLDIIKAAGLARDDTIVVPDPTILLGQFDALLTDQPTNNEGIFCYALRTDEVIRGVAETARDVLGAPLYAPRSSRQRWRDIGEGVTPGPVEWLRMLAGSHLVVSNSFHGIALSIVLNRPFIAVGLPGKRTGLNTRAQNLLALAGLENRMVDSVNASAIRQLTETPIEWPAVNARLADARQTAAEFLHTQLSECRSTRSPGASGPKEASR